MIMRGVHRGLGAWAGILVLLCAVSQAVWASGHKPHAVFLVAPRKVPYSKAGDPAGAQAGEKELKIRALVVDGQAKEWTTGELHDVTDRSFVVGRTLKINDALPGDQQGHWVCQRGPWLMVDRTTGRVAALKPRDYDPGVSQVGWFRNYAAHCSVTASRKSLYAVVAQLAVRKPVLAKKLEAFDPDRDPATACAPVEWQREPLRAVFHPVDEDAVSFDIVPGSAVLVEDSGDETEPAASSKAN